MKLLFGSIIAFLAFSQTGWRQKTLAEYNWNDIIKNSRLSEAAPSVVVGEPGGWLKIGNPNDAPLQVALLTNQAKPR